MGRESSPEGESGIDSQSGPTTSTEPDWITDEAASSETSISLVDPLLYAPLLLVGTALVVIPEPATTLVGIVCLAVGIGLAVADIVFVSDRDA